MKKFLSILLILSMVLSLAACGGSNKTEVSTEQTEEKQDEVVTLRVNWWGGDERHKATLDAIKKFEELNPNIKIKAEYGGWQGHQEKVTTQLAGGTAPDVMQINWNWLTIFSKDGNGFYDLNTLSDQLGLSNYPKDILEYAEVDGKLNGIPVSLTGRTLYFNKTTFDQFGAEIPETWDDFYAAAEKFNKKGYYPFDLDSYSAWILGMVYAEQKTGKQFISNDGKLLFTVEDIKEGLKLYKDFVDKGVVADALERAGEGGGAEAPLHQMSNWIEGKYAGVLEWTSSVGKYEKPLTEQNQVLVSGNLPVLENAKSKGWIVKPSMLFSINKDTKHPEEAAKFLNFLLNDPEGVKILGTSRGIPISKAAQDTLQSSGALSGLEYEGTELVLENKGLGISPYFEHSRLQDVYRQTIEKLAYGELDVDSGAQYLYDNVENVLKEIAQ
ncbi:MAG: ABC transporter substrate-binding protein [Bacillota bacterium]